MTRMKSAQIARIVSRMELLTTKDLDEVLMAAAGMSIADAERNMRLMNGAQITQLAKMVRIRLTDMTYESAAVQREIAEQNR